MNGFDRWADATVKTATWQVGWGDADFQHIFALYFSTSCYYHLA
jgi:hypothetical protein